MKKSYSIFLIITLSLFTTKGYATNDIIRISIKKAALYLKNIIIAENKNHTDSIHLAYSNRIIYNYINQKFYHQNKSHFVLANKYTPYFIDDKELYPLFHRLLKPNYNFDKIRVNDYLHTHSGIDQLLMYAIYADYLPTDLPLIENTLNSYTFSNSNIRGVAHCSLALKWMTDLTVKSKTLDFNDLKNNYISISLNYLSNHSTTTDDGMEAIITLILLDRIDLVKQNWIDEIILKQQNDGGWKWNDSIIKTDQHPTILAYWILSAWSNKQQTSNPNWFK